jgi:ferric-dicitrate binding protein FerR (iron transport regulator)
MTELDRHTEHESVSDQALRWFVRLHAGDCSDQERTVFQQWLNRSETHRTEYDRVTSLWREMDKMKSRPFPELEQAQEYWKERRSKPKGMLLRFQITGAIAAALALVLMGVWWWTMFRVEIAAYRTGKGEQRTIALSDGSNIQLNTDPRSSPTCPVEFGKWSWSTVKPSLPSRMNRDHFMCSSARVAFAISARSSASSNNPTKL